MSPPETPENSPSNLPPESPLSQNIKAMKIINQKTVQKHHTLVRLHTLKGLLETKQT